MTSEYIDIDQKFNSAISEYRNILKGVSAYIQMNNNYDDEEIYTLLGLLIGDSLDKFRNVAILKDTTIRWTYPKKGNEESIGVDLSKIEGQAKDVLFVKETLEEVIVGPINLVQGGRGFIVRIPIVKNNKFWGMASFVLKTEVVFQFIKEFEVDNNLKILITHKNKEKGIIYGNREILSLNPLLYESSDQAKSWVIYLVPDKGWFKFKRYFVMLTILVILISLYITYIINKIYLKYNHIKKKNKEVIAKSAIDSFTGIYNRGYFDITVLKEMDKSDKLNTFLSIIYFDLDNFKSINDDYGHVKGDIILLETTKRVSKRIRKSDTFFRWGGDEFVVLLPKTDSDIAIKMAREIKTVINSIEIEKGLNLSASIGVTQRVNNEFFESWFKRTDRALYSAKRNGRNRIKFLAADENVRIKIIWNNKWTSGKKWIDDDHIKLVNMSNKLIKSSFNTHNYNATIRIADNLIKEVENHFNKEIVFLEYINYPSINYHKIEHEKITEEFKILYKKIIMEEIFVDELIFFLEEKFIKGHLVNTDSNYREFLKNE